MRVIIDRFEGDFAVVELPCGTMIDMPKALVPEGAGQGAVIDITYNGEETKNKEAYVREKMDKLFGRK